ncbi:glycosyltransferase family 90 protein [Lepidopterella palustris CBS 459.81]|uniref:Glycosyltransferase family 90 protein n=1 Tax=Lepidopterella palustris CBS 459.81 TaxID=1314670 RepID=A0A8E2JBX8_9PEZI|nr:glycosyltransferase family 90 protein [Lepidopterella palustris CBS 459.81]
MTEPAIPLWTIFTATCPPFSPARSGSIPDLTLPPPLLMPATAPLHTYHGFVANWTLATDPCQHPHLGGLHGSFVRPLRKSTTGQLIPVFSTAKMAGNNDILVPAAMYYSGWDMFEADPVEINSTSWNQKANAIAWRGRASGGISTASNFMRFQRHRFLAMTNATTVAAAEACPQTNPRLGQNRKKRRWHGHSGASATSAPQHPNANCNDSTPGSIPFYTLPNPSTYPLPLAHSSSTRSTLSSWLSTWSPPTSTGFTNLTCRVPSGPNGTCPYNDDYFSPLPPLNLSAQINGFKYLPDIDGNSFSGRYRGFLLSTSVPLKATIYKEWHDKRLVPWAHFVPFDNTFVDLFGVMEYFIGDGVGRGGHDDQARRIAEDGKAWAERVLRKEDMEVYMLRLLLEWARVCDLQRERIGFVGDLV